MNWETTAYLGGAMAPGKSSAVQDAVLHVSAAMVTVQGVSIAMRKLAEHACKR